MCFEYKNKLKTKPVKFLSYHMYFIQCEMYIYIIKGTCYQSKNVCILNLIWTALEDVLLIRWMNKLRAFLSVWRSLLLF
jgi:hypothetical protein